ncbi:FG-GAP repeat domain-containing protein [Gimesia panareensis]|uniref:FG-GAP repeat domain-containing protein n=1 Tax=Gimesia panareensis TaxID=2527978 RepID=UPI00118A997F|nr:VCBS repeat-containing protein [Gimesia panareensis]QDU51280.1 FG-GAP repeat protein [Gimesia panareensis]
MMIRRRQFLTALVFFFSLNHLCSAEEIFEKPVRLQADGKVIDTGKNMGHSSPCIEDLDGDGLDDLILGDFGGHFQFYKNVGSNTKPVYQDNGKIKAGGKTAEVNIYCCVGAQPRFVDLNGDGIRDFISSSYDPGYCYYFRGLPDHKFADPVELKDSTGEPVQSAIKPKQNVQSFGSFYTPVDWDGDGDFDILIGCFDGELKLRINEGDATEYAFAAENQIVQAGEKPLKVEAHCCPVVADWNEDGLWDLLAGCEKGGVTWFQNVGTKTAPVFAEGKTLVENNQQDAYDQMIVWEEEDFIPAVRSQIEVVDYNQDGKLDLLLGDFRTTFDFRKGLTAKEKQQVEELQDQFKAATEPFVSKLKALQDDIRKRYPGDGIYTDKANEEWSKDYKALREGPEAKKMEAFEAKYVSQMRPFLASTHGTRNRSFDLAQPHGYVWLFLRK